MCKQLTDSNFSKCSQIFPDINAVTPASADKIKKQIGKWHERGNEEKLRCEFKSPLQVVPETNQIIVFGANQMTKKETMHVSWSNLSTDSNQQKSWCKIMCTLTTGVGLNSENKDQESMIG